MIDIELQQKAKWIHDRALHFVEKYGEVNRESMCDFFNIDLLASYHNTQWSKLLNQMKLEE